MLNTWFISEQKWKVISRLGENETESEFGLT